MAICVSNFLHEKMLIKAVSKKSNPCMTISLVSMNCMTETPFKWGVWV